MVVGEGVGGALARREKGLGRSSRSVSAEGVDSSIGWLHVAGLDIEEVLLAASHPVAVALADDRDGETVDVRDVDACDGEVPPIGARFC